LAAVMAGKGKAWPPSGQEDEHIYRFHCGERAAGDAEASAGAPASARGVADAVLTVGQYSAVAAGGVNSLNPRMRWLCSPTRSRTRAALAGPAPGRSWITRNPERSHRFAGIQPNSGQGDHSRLSCSAGDTRLGAGFCRDLQLSVLHGRWPSCGVAEKARIGRDLFRPVCRAKRWMPGTKAGA